MSQPPPPPQPFAPIRTAAKTLLVLLALVPFAVVSPACVYSPALAGWTLLISVFSIPWAYLALMGAVAVGFGFRERVAKGRMEETAASPAVSATARVIWFLPMVQAWLGMLSFAPEIDLGAPAPLLGGWTLLLGAGAFVSSTYYASPRSVAIGSALGAACMVVATVLLSIAYGAPWLYFPGLGLTLLPVSLAAAGVEASRQGAETDVG